MNQVPGPDGTEKRRHARKTTRQAAQIRFPDGVALAVEIRDYCQAGLYAVLPARLAPELAIPVLVGASVSVEFSAGQGAAARVHRLDGRVARVVPGGVGIFMPALPDAALEALHRASARPVAPGAGQPSPRQGQALHQECISQFHDFLDVLMQAFFPLALQQLTQAAQDEPIFLERTRYEHGAQALLEARGRIEDDFTHAVRERIRNVWPSAGRQSAADVRRDLSLVEEAEFEDWLNLSAVIRQVELDIASPLGEFEQRYSHLAGQPVDRKSNPLGLETLGRAFQGALQGLDFSHAVRALLYKAFGAAMSEQAPALYRRLNQTLAALPRLPAASARTRPAQAAPEPVRPDIAETLNRLYREVQSARSAAPENTEYSLDRIMATLAQSPHGPAAPDVFPSGAAGAVGATPADVLRMTDRLRQARRQLTAGGADAGASPAALPEAGLDEVFSALEHLLPGQTSDADAPSLAERIDARIAAAGGEPRRLAPAHRQILEAVSQLFGRARADAVPNSDVASLIARLERPLLKLSLRDTRFPATPDHPARQVLNLIEQFAVAADDRGIFFDARLQRFLYLLVERVCSRAEEDPGVYDLVRDSLARVLPPILHTRRARVARMQEASEGRERIRVARVRTNEALEARLAGQDVPELALRLLDAGWRQYLVLLEMREGRASPAWAAGVAVLDRLLAQLAAPAPDDAQTALLGDIEHGLATVNVDADLLAAFMLALGGRLADPAAGDARVFVPPGRLATAQGEAAAHGRLAERLRLGDWWEIGPGEHAVPMQLIWMSRPPHSCTFANRSATRKLDFTLDALAQQIRGGHARPGKGLDIPLLDRSEQALFDDSLRALAHQALHDPLTGLPNRKGFLQRLQQQPAPADAGKIHVVGVVEFDQFRLIRNACGEQAMERLARGLAERVRALIGPDAVLAAFSDDTFGLMMPDRGRAEGCDKVTQMLGQMRDFPFEHGAHSYRIGFNLGLAEYDPERHPAAEAVRRADSASLTAKSLGRNQTQVYAREAAGLQNLESLMGWAGRIDRYLRGEGLFLRCQKVVPTGAAPAHRPYCEILLGVDDGAGGEIPPEAFIPAVEHLQRSHELDIWVVGKVFDWIRDNRALFDALGGFAINLSPRSLGDPELASYLKARLAQGEVPADRIMFEITEIAAIQSYGAAQEFVRDIRRYGCKFALDDFGSGFTSYSHLKNLRTDTLKIDGSFVRDMLQNPADYAMVKSMNDIAHSLGLTTVAEYVESPPLIAALEAIGVDYLQGFALHKPCRIEALVP